MKILIPGIIITIAVLILVGFEYKKNETSKIPDKLWVIAPRFLYLKEGVSKDEARNWLENEYLPVYKELPGFNAMIGEPTQTSRWGSRDSTDKDKDFVMIYFFDSKETFDRYFPKDGFSNEIKEAIKKHQSTTEKLFGKYFIQDKYQFEDYLMFASSK